MALSTQRLRLMAVTSLLDRLYYYGMITTDFYRKFVLPTVQRPLPKPIPNTQEIEQVFRQTLVKGKMGIRDRAILEVYYASGIRRAELAGLNLQDIDFNNYIITIRKGKGGSDRCVPIAARALGWVEEYLREIRPELVTFDSGDALFLGKQGRRITPGKLSDLVGGYIKRSGIGKTGACHLFRHATATHMMQNGADIRHIQEMLGHKHISSTQIYTHVTIKELQIIYQATHPANLSNERSTSRHHKQVAKKPIDN